MSWSFCSSLLARPTVRIISEKYYQVALTFLSECPGTMSARYVPVPDTDTFDDVELLKPDICLQQLVSLSWCIMTSVLRSYSVDLMQATRVHKANLVLDESGAGDRNEVLLWWSKACNSDRAAEVLMPASEALEMWQKAEAASSDLFFCLHIQGISVVSGKPNDYAPSGPFLAYERLSSTKVRPSTACAAVLLQGWRCGLAAS